MSKRFSCTERWQDPWYRKLSPEIKNFWDYLCANCDNAGVWKPDFELASFCIGALINENILASLNEGKERIRALKNGYWWIVGFVDFQYGNDIKNPKVRKHVDDLVKKYAEFGYPTHTQSIPNKLGMDTPKDKDMEKDKSNTSIQPKGGVGEKEIVPVKPKTEAQAFVEHFSAIYNKATGQKFKADSKHFIIVNKLLKDHGLKTLIEKSNILAYRCQATDVFFTKDSGWAAFTIESLSAHWNRLLPQVRLSDQEIKDTKFKDDLKKLEAENAQFNKTSV